MTDDILKNIIEERKGQQARPSIDDLSAEEKKDLRLVAKEYINFLDKAKTTHETTKLLISMAKKRGFVQYTSGVKKNFYLVNKDESAIALVAFGKIPIDKGLTILGAHSDFCCLHLKDHPIKEDQYLGVRLDGRPYGGFWNHHYLDTDVDVLGRLVKNGKVYEFSFDGVIIDPTIHINHEIEDKTVKEAFKGEQLDILVGTRTKKEFLDKISAIAGIKIEEKDFSRTDVYAVPKFSTLSLMGDELIVGYGHDDRSSVFSIFEAIFRAKPTYTSLVFAFDREEIGSTGLTGAQGNFFEEVIDAITQGASQSDKGVRDMLRHSLMISADVDIALNFRNLDLSDPENAAKSGRGIVICRANGGRGQGGGNKAPAFLMDYIMTLWDKEKVSYQVSSIPSKIEGGGGGTIGRYFAERGVPTADCGAPISGMHGKRSILHAGDLYQCMKGFKVFMERKE
jgi:aspartyl aminopeptidase